MAHRPNLSIYLPDDTKEVLRNIAAQSGYKVGRGRKPEMGSIRGLFLAVAGGDLSLCLPQGGDMDAKIPMALNVLAQQVFEKEMKDISAEMQIVYDLIEEGRHDDAQLKLSEIQNALRNE